MFPQTKGLGGFSFNGSPPLLNKEANSYIFFTSYESILGQYFIGYADNLVFGQATRAWARLYNPKKSGVILHVNVWTVSDISESTFRAQFWFNVTPPISDIKYAPVTLHNTEDKHL